jgi:C-lobe and N-lobe beta barrels of Tf-binding protein B
MCIMRFVSLFAVLATSTALSGCAGGDGSALSLAVSGPVCGVNAGNCATPAPTPAPVTTNVTPPPPPPNTGNNATVTTGDGTIALEAGVIVATKANPALSKLTLTPATGSTPNQAKIDIDPKSVNKALWPVTKTMDEYAFGSGAYSGGLEGSAIGGTYKEYRSYSRNSAGTAVDEELQVWSFNHSYVTQYRDVTSAGAPATHQAWSFGGTKTPAAAMTLKGSGSYNGKWGATARTSGFADTTFADQTISYNNEWAIVGDSSLSADFISGNFSGTLTPREWTAWANLNGAKNFQTIDLATATGHNVAPFMYSKVYLKGTITNNATTGNSIAGSAALDPRWLTNTSSNAMYAGVFGPNAEEISGVFGLDATAPAPLGGYFPITDDRRGYITMSGVFNGQ